MTHVQPNLYFFFYQILTAFNKLNIKSEVVHEICKGLNLFEGFIIECLIEETAALNVSTESLKTMGCGSRF